MDVLIKGTAMPQKCGLCPCFHAGYPMYCQAVPAEMGKRIVAPYEQPRPDWCPLVPLPEGHGRLIDIDNEVGKLCHKLGIRSLDYLTAQERVIVQWFMEAPTIIPAEEE